MLSRSETSQSKRYIDAWWILHAAGNSANVCLLSPQELAEVITKAGFNADIFSIQYLTFYMLNLSSPYLLIQCRVRVSSRPVPDSTGYETPWGMRPWTRCNLETPSCLSTCSLAAGENRGTQVKVTLTQTMQTVHTQAHTLTRARVCVLQLVGPLCCKSLLTVGRQLCLQ